MIAFIILHYKTYLDTAKCIESIRACCADNDYQIIVVDNGGDAESRSYFENTNNSTERLHFIYNDKNLGFSAGNNIGCRYAIEKFSPDFLYVLNNDTAIADHTIFDNIQNIYSEQNFDILGPSIYDITEVRELNPGTSPSTEQEVLQDLEELYYGRKWLKYGAVVYWLAAKRYRLKHKKQTNKAFSLCGAALIFSRQYYERFEQIFAELTYMYCEESILVYRAHKYNLKMIYDPRTQVLHFGSKSTKRAHKSKIKMFRFKVQNQIAALERLLEVYRNNEDV